MNETSLKLCESQLVPAGSDALRLRGGIPAAREWSLYSCQRSWLGGTAFVALIAAALPAQAKVLVRDDFRSYAIGTITTPTSLTGGTGWSGGWSYPGTGANLQIVNKVWSRFPGYGFEPAKAVTTTDANAREFNRLIDTNAVNFTVPGTYNFSLLVDNEETISAFFTGVTTNANPAKTAESLAPASWTNIGTIRIGQQNEAIFLDSINSTRRFYRLQLAP